MCRGRKTFRVLAGIQIILHAGFLQTAFNCSGHVSWDRSRTYGTSSAASSDRPTSIGQFTLKGKAMRKFVSTAALFGLFAVAAFAESYSGKLLDASCYDQQKKASACDATSTTASFAIDVSGTVYKLDTAGNTKASAALKNRADRVDPSKPQTKDVMAKVEGTEKAGTITVTSIDVQ